MHPDRSALAAKVSRSETGSSAGSILENVNRLSNPAGLVAPSSSQQGNADSGIAPALHMAMTPTKSSLQSLQAPAAEGKAFLQSGGDTLAGASRSPDGNASQGDASGSHSGQQSSRQGNGEGAPGKSWNMEASRLTAVESGETRPGTLATQPSAFSDRQGLSQLSAQVVQQILGHLDRLRESDRGRVKFQLGVEGKTPLSVELRLSGGRVEASFSGDASMLGELEAGWPKIEADAAARGLSLGKAHFLSDPLASEGSDLLPDVRLKNGEKSQSVIQPDDNQLVRPGFQTAAAGSSGPVHLFA
jgi:hypothetical protein